MAGQLDRPPQSRRVAAALALAQTRREQRRARLRPLAWALVAIAVAAIVSGEPAPSTSGRSAGVLAALCVYVLLVALTIRGGRLDHEPRLQAGAVVALGLVAVALAALQTKGATELPAATAVWVAVSRIPGRAGTALAAAIGAGASVAGALSGSSAAQIAAALLLYALLGLMAHSMTQARESQERTELLLAELQDARDEQARAAALAERARIAGELHDVLAHSLSGAAIQLQGARKLAERDGASADTRAAIGRAVELVRGGLDDARRAVGALRGAAPPADLAGEVARMAADLGADARVRVDGAERELAPAAAHALRRAAQEALTNAARHAPGAPVEVVLAYGPGAVELSVENRGAVAAVAPALASAGGGHGLAAMRERAERAGGTLSTGPTPEGWRVELRVPG